MSWIQTYTGRKFTPLDPRPDQIDIRDIAHSLSLQCRFNGHCREFYSVAEHSLRVSHILPADRHLSLYGLLHDAAEAYVSDLPRPLKALLPTFAEAEDRLLQAILTHFGLPWPVPDEVWLADNTLLLTESRDLMAPPPEPWNIEGAPLPDRISPIPPQDAESSFLDRFHQLTK